MHNLDDISSKEYFPGFKGKIIYSTSMTFAYWDIVEGCELPEHAHVHEQVVNVLEGEFELIVDGTPHKLSKGSVYTIASNVPHAGKSITDCKILDVFSPKREDL